MKGLANEAYFMWSRFAFIVRQPIKLAYQYDAKHCGISKAFYNLHAV
jgi:hypothetical protein